MQDHVEQALLAIANSINWVWTPNGKGGGRWNGHVGQTEYRINSPLDASNVDASCSARFWRLSVRSWHQWQSEGFYNAPVPTAERAKELCLYHTLKGDVSEILRLAEAGRAEDERFKNCSLTDLPLLTDLLKTLKPSPLH